MGNFGKMVKIAVALSLIVETGILMGLQSGARFFYLAPPSVIDPEVRIDLNQPDLEELRKQLRQTFQKQVLSDGAIKGIIEWRREKGVFTDLSQLNQIRGIGAFALSILREKIKPLLEPLPDPVRMAFVRDHETADGAQWVVEQWDQFLEGIESSRPLIVWVENAVPYGIPANLDQLVEVFLALTGLPPEWVFSELMKVEEPMAPVLAQFLEQAWTDSLRGVPFTEERFFSGPLDPFGMVIREWITTLKRQGWAIKILPERPPRESYVVELQGDVLGRTAMLVLPMGQPQDALKSLEVSFRFRRESNRLRETVFGPMVIRIQQEQPHALHLIFRGAGHADLLMQELFASGVRYQHQIQEEVPNNNLTLFQLAQERYESEGYPTSTTPRGSRLLREMLLRHCLDEFVADRGGVDIGGFDALIVALPDALVDRWFTEVATRSFRTLTALGTTTWEWLGHYKEEMMEEAVALYERIRWLPAPKAGIGQSGSSKGAEKPTSELINSSL